MNVIKKITWEILDTSGYDSDGSVLLSGDEADLDFYKTVGVFPQKEKGFQRVNKEKIVWVGNIQPQIAGV